MQTEKISKPSIKLNFILNLLRVFSAALVGIITMPYLNRVLGAEYIGRIEYVYTIVNYFVLFSALGIPMYGIREISKHRENNQEVLKIIVELYTILFFTTIISYIILFGIVIRLDYFAPYKDILVIMSSMIFLSNIGAEWYFQGIENQKFITIRYICIRIIVFGLIFLLIKNSNDYVIYALLLVILTFGANVINFGYIINSVLKNKINYKDLNLKRHFKPIMTIFIATISVNIYLQLDNFLIGSISGDKYVGYYAVANKLIRYIISFITIIGAVMLPRLSYLFVNDKIQYYDYLKKSLNLMLLSSIPCSIYFFIFSKEIIAIMGGEQFVPAIITMKILSPLCIIVSLAYFFGFLILYPQGLEKVYTRATILSALFSILINFFAIKYFQQNGAAVIAVLSELSAISIMFFYLKKQKLISTLIDSNLLKIIAINAIFLIFLQVFYYLKRSFQDINYFFVFSALFGICYMFLLLIFKEKNTIELYNGVILKKNKN